MTTEVATSELTEVELTEVLVRARRQARRHDAPRSRAGHALRAPLRSDVPAMVALVGNRRVAENTARIPHPYTAADPQDYRLGQSNGRRDGICN